MTSAGVLPVLDAGTRVGAYRIVGPLGGGGMGMVYRAVHALLDRPAAIKVLRPELGNHAMAIDRFLTEARATTAIRHPGIVEIYDYGHTDAGDAYIAMELLEGRTLGAWLAEHGRLGVVEAMTLARRIAAPLAVAHDRGVVHRDLKPDNVFLVRDHEGGAIDQVKLLDFGIAKLVNAGASNRTTIGLVLGTPAYMSPEQCRGSAGCDHRTDLYSLGCVVFEMLTGQPPYGTDRTYGDLLAAHMQSFVPDLGRLVTVPSEIARLVTRLLAKRPDDRPASALEVVAEIDRWFASRGEVVPAPHRRARRAALAACGLALALAGIAGSYLAWRSEQPQPTDHPIAAPPALPPQAAPPMTAPRSSAQQSAPPAAPRVTAQQSAPPAAPPPAAPRPAAAPPPPAPPRRAAKPRSAQPAPPASSDVTAELGRASAGDVNTVVNDVKPP